MTREEACMDGFRIISQSGKAKSKLLDALEQVNLGNLENAQRMIEKAEELICSACSLQSLFEEKVEEENLYFVVEHGYHHVQSTLVLKDYILQLKYCPELLQDSGMYHIYH